MLFRDRAEAGSQLAVALEQFRGSVDVVLALPPGGPACASPVAQKFGAPLDLVFVLPIYHPTKPHIVGAVSENGNFVLSSETCSLNSRWVEDRIANLKQEIITRRRQFLLNRPPIALRDKTVLLIDDGTDADLLLKAAVINVRKHNPLKIIVGMPVGNADLEGSLRGLVENIVIVRAQENGVLFSNIYSSLKQVTDLDIKKIIFNNI